MIRQTVVSATALIGVVAALIVAPGAAAASSGTELLETPVSDGRIIVIDEAVADESAVADAVSDALADDGAESSVLEEVGAIVAPLTDADADAIAAIPGVEVIDDQPVTIGSNSTQTNAPWNLSRLDQQFLPVDSAYSYPAAAGAGVRVYIVDSGVTPNAQQFGSRLLAGATAVNDGRGSSDCNGHGTHVAGSVASTSWGVAKQASIVPVRVFDCSNSASLSTVLDAIDWVIANHPSGAPGVINMSLSGAQNVAMDNAVAEATAAGLIVVAAAGNSARNACLESPAAAPGALTVGASTIQDARASFSNFGTCLDIFAPGENIISVDNDTASPVLMSGTSMAAPHVAGAAALLWSASPGSTARGIESSLINQAVTGRLSSIGTGSPNRLLSSVAIDSSLLPGAVSNVAASAINHSSARVTWTAPTVNPGLVTDYRIQFRRGGTTTWLTATDGVSASTAATISGLQANTGYDVRVRAESAAGSGPFSSAVNLRTPSGAAQVNLPSPIPVYRFWNHVSNAHFYTQSAAERDWIIATFPASMWRYEGVAFSAYPSPASGLTSLFRFWNDTSKAHFYTTSEAERDYILVNFPNSAWRYEGIAFYVLPPGPSDGTSQAVSRFYSQTGGTHFFTASDAERDAIRAAFPERVWRYEGVAFRVPR